MEHVVQAVVLPAALHRHHVLGVGHHAQGSSVPLGAGADGAGPLPFSQVLTDGTGVDVGLGVRDSLGEGGGFLLRQRQHIKRQTLGGLDAHPRQLGEVLH